MAAESDVRIVLLGKTGVGKSASGNTILGSEEFVEKSSAKSVTRQCSKFETKVSGRKVVVVDSPGLFDTSLSNEELKAEIVNCVYMTVPGPHVFLLVLRLGTRFTEEEQKTMKWIQTNFSKLALKYAMVLFTCEDAIDEPLEDYIKESPQLQQLVSDCDGRCHTFDNRKKDRTQVTRLLAKIDKMVAANGGRHYTDQMYLEAQRKIREEEERKRRQEEAKRQEEERKREEVQRKREEALRKELEAQERQRRAEDQARFEEENRRRATEDQQRREQDRLEYERRRAEDQARYEAQEERRREEERKSREEERREWQRQRDEERRRYEEAERKRQEEERKKSSNNSNPFVFLGKAALTPFALLAGAAAGAVEAVVDVPVDMVKSGVESCRDRYGDDPQASDIPGVFVTATGAELVGGVKSIAKAPTTVFSGAANMVDVLWK